MDVKLHLVDDDGRPLADHIVDAVERIKPLITRRFFGSCDPAELSDSMEDGARAIAEQEIEKGPLRDVKGFAWRVLFNRATSIVRSRSKESSLGHEDLLALSDASVLRNTEPVSAGLYARELLATLSERDRLICWFDYQGFTTTEIALELRLSKTAVWQARSRLRSRLRNRTLGL